MNKKRAIFLLVLAAFPLAFLFSTNLLLRSAVDLSVERKISIRDTVDAGGTGGVPVRRKPAAKLSPDNPADFNIMRHDQFTMTAEQYRWDWDRLRSSINAGKEWSSREQKTDADIEKEINLYNIRIDTVERQIEELRRQALSEGPDSGLSEREKNLNLMKMTLEVLKKQCAR